MSACGLHDREGGGREEGEVSFNHPHLPIPTIRVNPCTVAEGCVAKNGVAKGGVASVNVPP